MKKSILTILGVMLIAAIPSFSQVTIGSLDAPQPFSVLELISNAQRGLRLPQLTTLQRMALEQATEFKNQATGLAKGLTIFNTDTGCMETWNGWQWISWCGEGTITALGCSSVTGINVTQGTPAYISTSLPYTGMVGAKIDLTDNQSLGSAGGLSVQIDGAQTLFDPNGTIAIKITGTAITFGTITIPISLAGASCSINVAAAQQAGTIGSLGCASLPSLNVTQGAAANLTTNLPYFNKLGADIALTDNQLLGSVSGLSVLIDNNQTLSAPNGGIAIKITGTAITYGLINIPISLAGANCSISVNATQQGGTILSLGCSSVTGVNVMQGIPANIPAILPFTTMTGSNINLADGMVLGSANGLSVVVNGNQTLVAAANGQINIKITGTANVTGAISIPVSLAGASCNINVTSDVNPANLQQGYGSFTGRTCFDVVRINDGGACGTLAGRQSQKADFNQPSINTQDYVFKPNGNVSNVRFYAIDLTGKVIQDFTPKSYPGITSYGTSRTVTVTYFSSLNQDAAGLSRANALRAMLYVVYNDNAAGTGVDRKLQLQVSVQDCSCCPGYLSVGGEYTQTVGTLTFSTANFTTVQAYFTRTPNDVCFYMTDYVSTVNLLSSATSVCSSPSFMDPTIQAMGWRLPNIAELGAINGVATNLANQPTSIQGTANMNSNPIAGPLAYYWSSSVNSNKVSYGWSYGQGNAQIIASNNRVRCVRTQ